MDSNKLKEFNEQLTKLLTNYGVELKIEQRIVLAQKQMEENTNIEAPVEAPTEATEETTEEIAQ